MRLLLSTVTLATRLQRAGRPAGLAALVAAAVLAGCQPTPEPIAYGTDACAHCKMVISDPRFGAELLTTTGKAYPFDSIECLAGYIEAHPEDAERTHSLWVSRYDAPDGLVPLDDVVLVQSPDIHSPMGRNLAAFSPAAVPDGAQRLTWDQVLALVGPETGMGHGHGPTPSASGTP